MKYLVIVADCVVAGRNVRGGDILELDKVPERDAVVVVGCGLAMVRDLYPVPAGGVSPKGGVSPAVESKSKPKKAKK